MSTTYHRRAISIGAVLVLAVVTAASFSSQAVEGKPLVAELRA
jgi:hypothetical protein